MRQTLWLAVMVLGVGEAACAADWPQFRCDAARGAASAEELPAALYLKWARQLPPPRPAFPGEVRLQFDASYEPVVAGKTLFVASMVTDSVTAFDTETGQRRWQFFTEGPVRFAPAVWQGNVYFVSDDGHLYCVSAADGRMRWKFRGIPPGKQDRKLLGGGRLISLWPARGGPVVHEGIVYFGAGLWSTYGVAIYALDAKSGKRVWANTDSNRIPAGNMDHGVGNDVGLSPQGYLGVVNGMLIIPCGGQLPAFLDLKTGALKTYCMGWGGRNGLPKGTWFVAGTRNYLSHGGDLYDLNRPADEVERPPLGTPFKNLLYPGGFTRVQIAPSNQKALGPFSKPVFAGDTMYDRCDQAVAAFDLSQTRLEERAKLEVPPSRRSDTYPDRWKAVFREVWRMPSTRAMHIKAGRHLFLGDKGLVQAVQIPAAGQEPRVVWEANLEGTPQSMQAADQKLFVATREGWLYAFGGQETSQPVVHAEPPAAAPRADAWTATAADILKTTKVREGYALVLGVGTGRLVEELVRQSTLDVIALERDAKKVDELRQRLDRGGLYGTRVSVHVGDPLAFPLPPYLASLVVSEDWGGLRSLAGSGLVGTVFYPLRPYGGSACLRLPPVERAALAGEAAESRLAGLKIRSAGDWVLLSRDGPLPGSADWSHAEADAANTGASAEKFLQAPLDLLWFDGPPPWLKPPGATLVRVCGGRVLIMAEKLQAVDAYTGRRLWETKLPFSHGPTDQIVAVEDAIYVAGSTTCLVFDPATGRQSGRIELPPGLTDLWSNLRVSEQFLVGQSGNELLCLDRRGGRLLWRQTCRRPKFSIALGGGLVFCSERASPRHGESAPDDGRTRAFDLASGKLVWEMRGGSELHYCPDLDLLLVGDVVRRGRDGSPGPALVDPPRPYQRTSRLKIVPKPLFVTGSKLLYGSDDELVTYDLRTGQRVGEPMEWFRRGCTLPRASSNFVVTRFLGNAACIDLATRQILQFWNVRTACSNSGFPADGLLNMPSLTGGCSCNYLPVSAAYAPTSVFRPVKTATAAAAPPLRSRAEVKAVLAQVPQAPPPAALRPLEIVLIADQKDHGPGEHDYPLWQKRWKTLLGGMVRPEPAQARVSLYGPPPADPPKEACAGAPGVSVTTAWQWPTAEQLQSADLVVMFCYRSGGSPRAWNEQRMKDLDAYLSRGGGFVVIHSATYSLGDLKRPEEKRLVGLTGLVFDSSIQVRHGPMTLQIAAPQHPICRGLPPVIQLVDEPYWPAVGDLGAVEVLATSVEAVGKGSQQPKPQPMFWTYQRGKGRVFGCVPGHFNWTFDDPYFRLLLLRGMAWTAGESPYRFDPLTLRGVSMRDQ